MLAGQVSLLLVAIYYAGQFEARLGTLERGAQTFQLALDRINDAREKTDLAMGHMTDVQSEANSKIGQILVIVQELEQGTEPPTPEASGPFTGPAQPAHPGH